jgi:hypothetical protein
MSHTCHALNCQRRCRPEYLMCLAHWRMVPRSLQNEVYRHYREGQCEDMGFSRAWHYAAYRAINAVALREGILTCEQANARIARLDKVYADRS